MTAARTARNSGDCRSLLEELQRYLDGDLSPARCRAIERHLSSCVCCGNLAERIRRAVAVCQAAGRSRLPPKLRRHAQKRIEALLEGAGESATSRLTTTKQHPRRRVSRG
jgi:anti-sigma factor RsiW